MDRIGPSEKFLRETLHLSHKVQKSLPCILNCFSEGSLGVDGSNLSPWLSGFCLKDYTCAIKPLNNFVPEDQRWKFKCNYVDAIIYLYWLQYNLSNYNV